MSIHTIQPNETAFLDTQNVLVTNARFIVNNQTYAMNGVTSVKDGYIKPKRAVWIVLAIISALMIFGADTGMGKFIALIFAAIFAFIAYSLKPTGIVILQTSSGEVKAVESKDIGFIINIVNALNTAIIHRG